MGIRVSFLALIVLWAAMLVRTPSAQVARSAGATERSRDITSVRGYGTHFQTSERCFACHNGITSPSGEDISIGLSWRTSMMANAGRDPYWMAGVRRETIDHPSAAKAIEDECTICHMPMMRYEAKMAGGEGQVFAHLPPDPGELSDQLAHDGVSCTVCHQITEDRLGTPQSFVGQYKIDEKTPAGERQIFGPFEIEKGHTTVMHSSSTFRPTQGKHVRTSELCATCHTLITKALDRNGNTIGELPEQVPYQEWLHSEFKETKTCQSCHMPAVAEDVPITSVFGEPRQGFARHTFVGGNFFMQRVLGRFRNDLAVAAEPHELDAAANRTIAHLQSESAHVAVRSVTADNGQLSAVIRVENLGGHKLPTGYPSRRVWLHVTVRNRNGTPVFESGAPGPTGAIQGNDNDEDPSRVEPHYAEITRPDQVQIYESAMVDADGKPTTGLLSAVRYVKDNRLLPRGFDKRSAGADIAVHGEAASDADFGGGADEVRYVVPVNSGDGPFEVEAELRFQPIAFRWAMNLKNYDAPEPRRFVGYYEQSAAGSSVVLARARSEVLVAR